MDVTVAMLSRSCWCVQIACSLVLLIWKELCRLPTAILSRTWDLCLSKGKSNFSLWFRNYNREILQPSILGCRLASCKHSPRNRASKLLRRPPSCSPCLAGCRDHSRVSDTVPLPPGAHTPQQQTFGSVRTARATRRLSPGFEKHSKQSRYSLTWSGPRRQKWCSSSIRESSQPTAHERQWQNKMLRNKINNSNETISKPYSWNKPLIRLKDSIFQLGEWTMLRGRFIKYCNRLRILFSLPLLYLETEVGAAAKQVGSP